MLETERTVLLIEPGVKGSPLHMEVITTANTSKYSIPGVVSLWYYCIVLM